MTRPRKRLEPSYKLYCRPAAISERTVKQPGDREIFHGATKVHHHG